MLQATRRCRVAVGRTFLSVWRDVGEGADVLQMVPTLIDSPVLTDRNLCGEFLVAEIVRFRSEHSIWRAFKFVPNWRGIEFVPNWRESSLYLIGEESSFAPNWRGFKFVHNWRGIKFCTQLARNFCRSRPVICMRFKLDFGHLSKQVDQSMLEV
ncbi:MAG: hypothetical protein JWM11_5666 [Planctomycetaceae bacterium]|nr:hypothetical protein [Planctomycetaceae bacterium]